ncbi:MAG: hypothetical protein ACPLTR_06770 [Thermacetogeniaceae bacterium]
MERKKVFPRVCVLVICALALMGWGFAKWSDSVAVHATAQSGALKWGFEPNSLMIKDSGCDWTCDMNGGMRNIRPVPERKDVGSTSGELSDTNGDGFLDTLTIVVNNAYPSYYNEISATVFNYGTIPVIIQHPMLHWMGNSETIEDGVVYLLCEDGSILKYAGQNPEEVKAVIEFKWMNNDSRQQHPGVEFEESGKFHVLQPAGQNKGYAFSLTIQAVQWNEG